MAGTTAAFFDFDRTLLVENSPKLGIRYLWDMGQVSLGYVLKAVVANWFYQRSLMTETAMANLLLSLYTRSSLGHPPAGDGGQPARRGAHETAQAGCREERVAHSRSPVSAPCRRGLHALIR